MRRPAALRGARPLLWSVGTGDEAWAMFRAAAGGDVRALRRMLRRNPALARCQYAYRTPLSFALREGQRAAVELLLEYVPLTGEAVKAARERGHDELAAALERRLDARGEPLAAAIRARDWRAARRLLDGDPSLVRAHDGWGNQPLHWAVMTRQLRVIDALLERGADIEAKRFDGARPLQLVNGDYHFRGWRDVAAETKTTPMDVLRHLRKRGAACDLCTACCIGDEARVREILAADPGAANRPSEYVTYYPLSGTPLRNAAEGGHIGIVRLLLAHGADPNLPEEGIAPRGHALHTAVCRGHREIVELLLAHGAHPNVPVESSADTLSAAIRRKDEGMVELLTSHGAARSMELLAYYGDTATAAAVLEANPRRAGDPQALCYAAEEGHKAFVRLLLRYRPGLAKRVGVAGKTRAITELLFAHGMNPNHREWLGATPLHQFARRGDIGNATLFLDRGARLNPVDDELRQTPLGWAEYYGQAAMAEFLRSRGATSRPSRGGALRPSPATA